MAMTQKQVETIFPFQKLPQEIQHVILTMAVISNHNIVLNLKLVAKAFNEFVTSLYPVIWQAHFSETELLVACRGYQIKRVEKLLEVDYEKIYQVSNKDETPIEIACSESNVSIVFALFLKDVCLQPTFNKPGFFQTKPESFDRLLTLLSQFADPQCDNKARETILIKQLGHYVATNISNSFFQLGQVDTSEKKSLTSIERIGDVINASPAMCVRRALTEATKSDGMVDFKELITRLNNKDIKATKVDELGILILLKIANNFLNEKEPFFISSLDKQTSLFKPF